MIPRRPRVPREGGSASDTRKESTQPMKPRELPTLDDNIERMVEDAGHAAATTLEGWYDAAENGLLDVGKSFFDFLTEEQHATQHGRPSPTLEFLKTLKAYADELIPYALANELLVMIMATATGIVTEHAIALQREFAKKTEQGKQESAKEIEQNIDAAHDTAGQLLRAREDLRKEFTPAQIDAVADALEGYESKKLFAVYARHSGLSTSEVASYNYVTMVFPYSNGSLDAFLDVQEQSGAMDKEAVNRLRKEGKGFGGFYSHGVICLNVSAMVEGAKTQDEIRARTTDVLHHENTHGFGGYWAKDMKTKDGLDRFSEGATEVFSNLATQEIGNARKDPFPGYISGEAAAAAVVYESLFAAEQKMMLTSYIHGRVDELDAVYNKKFGAHAFGDMVYVNDLTIRPEANAWIAETGINNYNEDFLRARYMSVASLDRALVNVGDDWADVAQRANTHLGTGLIVPIRGENLNGVLVVSAQSKNELTGGMVRLDGTHGRRVVLLAGWTNNGLLVLPGTNVAYLAVDLDAQSLSRTDFEEQSFNERGAAVVKMLRTHRTALLHFREM